MWVHWKRRWMRFTHENRRIKLKGIQDDHSTCRHVSTAKLHVLLRRGAIVDCVQVQPIHQEAALNSLTEPEVETVPIIVQTVLAEFDALFCDPIELPPRRDCDHHVPLVAGAQPVNVCP